MCFFSLGIMAPVCFFFPCGYFCNSTGELPYKVSKGKEARRNSEKKLSHSNPLLLVGIYLIFHLHSSLSLSLAQGSRIQLVGKWPQKSLFNLYRWHQAGFMGEMQIQTKLPVLQATEIYAYKSSQRTSRKHHCP